MAKALVDYGMSQLVTPNPESVEDYQNFPGEGIHGKIDGKDIYIGNRKIGVRAGCSSGKNYMFFRDIYISFLYIYIYIFIP